MVSLDDDANWNRIRDWLTESRDDLREQNDEAPPEEVLRNQGGLRELNEIIRSSTHALADVERAKNF